MTATAVAAPSATLRRAEQTRLAALETTVEAGLRTFVEVGEALGEIRDSRLYRDSHETFEGYCRERWGMDRVHAHRHIEAAQVVAVLSTDNIEPPANLRQARELTPLARDEAELAETWRELREEHGENLTAARVREAVSARLRRDQVVGSLTASGGSSEWYTPKRYVEAARGVLGHIDLDPASCELANATVRADRIFTAEDDGLTRDWPGRVWMNPPYGGQGPKFVAHLLSQYEQSSTTAAIALLNSNTTDTRWFQPLFAYPICFARKRIGFDHPFERSGQPTHGSLFAYLGPDGDRFARVFSEFGAVVTRHPASTPSENADTPLAGEFER